LSKDIGDEIRLLWKSAADFGIELTESELEMFSIYLDELWEWTQHINLIGLSSRERIVIELFLDSLIPVPFFPKQGSMLDVGSGAGIPGFPVKIHRPSIKLHLLESNAKKVNFLKHVARLLNLKDITIHRGRIESQGSNLNSERFGIITAKAFGPLEQVIQHCAPLLMQGGMLVSFLGAGANRELRRAKHLMERYKLRVYKAVRYTLPGKLSERNTMLLKREV